MPRKLTQNEFIEKCKNKYGDSFDLSKVEYVNSTTKVKILCHKIDKYGNEHGEFLVRPADFLMGHSCAKCKGNYQYKNIEEFVNSYYNTFPNKKEQIEIPINQVYKNNKTKIKVICHMTDKYGNEHGEFLIRPNDLISDYCCPKCGNNTTKTTIEFIKDAIQVHGNKYNYSKVNYINAYSKVTIICPIHGEYEQIPSNHLNGSNCPYCNANIKSRMEEKITQLLINENYNFERQKTFKWLKYKKNLYLDFFLPDYNIAIEYQGNQHFKPISLWGGEQELYLRKERDKVKRKLCEKHNIKIFYLKGKISNINKIKMFINETTNKRWYKNKKKKDNHQNKKET